MSKNRQPTPPSSGNGAAPAACTEATCPQPTCPNMEIEINNTPATNDDLVLLKCGHPVRRSMVDCRIRATGSPPNDATVVVTNPDGRLRFPGDGDTSRTLTIPRDGSWVTFQISGERGSDAIGDAIIEAHCNTATGALVASKAVTVVWFDQAQINVTPGSDYSMVGDRYTATPGNAVDYSAQARIRPAGVDCTAPQLTNLRIGMIQNLIPPYSKTKTWDGPAIAWNAGVPAGTTLTVPTSISYRINVPAVTNDSETSVAPLYDQPGKTGTLDANSLKPPVGCAGGGAATSHDTPSTPFPATFAVPARTAAGVEVGTVTYGNRVKVILNDNFKIWAVVFNTASNDLCAIRERDWSLHVDSSAANQRAAAAADSAPTVDPVTAPPFGNDRTNDPANQSTGAEGAATTTFTKP